MKVWLNRWRGEIVRWEIAAVTKGINGGYCRGGCKLNRDLENERVLYWKLSCCCLTLKEKRLLRVQLFDDCIWTIKSIMISEYTRIYNDSEWDLLAWACGVVCPILLVWDFSVSVLIFHKLFRTVEGSEVKWVVKFGISNWFSCLSWFWV